MAKVLSADIAAVGSDNSANIENCITTTRLVKYEIESFNSSTLDTLKGGGYDAVRKKLELYKKVYDVAYTLCVNILSHSSNVNNSMLNYMEGYSELDDSKIKEIDSKLKEIKGYINYLYDKSSSASDDGTNYSALMSEWNGIYNTLSHYRELLAGLSGKDSALYGTLEAIINDVANFARAVNGINESTFTPEGLKSGKGMYNFDKDQEIFDSSITGNKKYGKYTREDMMNMTEAQVRAMSKQEFIEFIGAIAQDIYAEYGGVLPSITIAQAILESGYGNSFENTSHNVYGLIGYPGSKPLVNRLRKFDNFYESTLYHYKYFQNYSKVYAKFLQDCKNKKAISACKYLSAYCAGSTTYGPTCEALIRQYNLTQYDNI